MAMSRRRKGAGAPPAAIRQGAATPPPGGPESPPAASLGPAHRPPAVHSVTYRARTTMGTMHCTITTAGTGDESAPREVFLLVGKTGSDVAGFAEAFGRLLSLVLRLPSPVPPAARLVDIAHLLAAGAGPAPRDGETSQPVHVVLEETLRAFLDASADVLR